MSRVTILGNYSGRNAGDNAILGSLLHDLSGNLPNTEFLVPTLNPAFVRRRFGQYRIRPLGLMPWHGSIKILGCPTLYAMCSSDLILVTDNILFDRRYFDPTSNYLSTISWFVLVSRWLGIPVVLYNAGVGPISSDRGAAALARVLADCPLAILRDNASLQLLESFGTGSRRLVRGADCALNTPRIAMARRSALLRRLAFADRGAPLIAFNVNAHIRDCPGGPSTTERAIRVLAAVADRTIRTLGANVLLLVTQVMDTTLAERLVAAMGEARRVRVASTARYDYLDLAGLLAASELVVAMRTHALILACAMGTPVVDVNVQPKSRAFLQTLGAEAWSLPLSELSECSLFDLITRAWEGRDALRAALRVSIAREQVLARAGARLVARLLGAPTPDARMGVPWTPPAAA
jgi:polysaccharide pyruvyl transferase WcaK-like protein